MCEKGYPEGLEAGDRLGIRNDNPPAQNHQATTEHLATQLIAAGISWRTYQEDISGTDCPLTDRMGYRPKHNPFVFFDDLTGTNDPMNADCIAHNRPLIELAPDLRSDRVARYNFIVGNLCHDMHDSCPPTSNPIRQGDDWLSTIVPGILASNAYQQGGALFITWDEGEVRPNCLLANCPIGMIVLSPFGKMNNYSNMIMYDHSSTLKTLQEIFGVRPFLRNAARATSLSDLFMTYP